jgi:TolB-like protein
MEGESPKPTGTPTGAVFLSYASQDAEAAKRICDALRAAGVEVWFDQSELRGGDAWDRQIRDRIHDCRLFIAVISANTEARDEGYFRREWKLAVDRTHDMSEKKAFLLPVVIDNTPEPVASVPDKFRELQWTRLPAGETPPAFVARIQRLLSRELSTPVRTAANAVSVAVPAVSDRGRAAWWPKPALIVMIVAAASVALAYFVFDKLWLSTRRASDSAGTASSSIVREKSIAVLPFVDMSEKHDQEYFGDGLAEQVLNELSRIPALKVIGRTSSFRFRDKAGDLRELGRALGASYVLEGSVRRGGEQLRVTAQLISTRDGSHLWSQTYDRNPGNALQLQEEIATAIARTLQVTITDYFNQQYTTRSPEAFDIFLRGVRDLDMATPESARRAVTEFERASQLDPQFVPAVVGQAYAYNTLAGNAYMPATEAYPRARLAVDRALAIDPRNADAYATRALIRINFDRDWSGAAADIAKAQEYGGSRIAYLPTAKIAGATGDMVRAAEVFEAQLATDPMDGESLQDLGWFVYPALGRYEEADAVLHRAHEVDADYTNAVAYFAGINLLLRKRLDEAAEFIDAEKDPAAREALRASVDHARGKSRDSDAAMSRAIAARNAWSWAIARAYAYRGDKLQALKWLERAAADHESVMWTVRSDPMLRSLGKDEDFRAFLRKINILE